jgi:hypothetical protein
MWKVNGWRMPSDGKTLRWIALVWFIYICGGSQSTLSCWRNPVVIQ